MEYLAAIQKAKHLPNFWMSLEYIELKGLKYSIDGGLRGFKDNGEWYFPPLNALGELETSVPFYSSVVEDGKSQKTHFKVLDYQYIYDPKSFNNLQGKQWKAFRRNIRKYPARSGGALVYRPLTDSLEDSEAAETLLLKWADGRELFDNELLIQFVLMGKNRWGLFNDGVCVGMNVFDENYAFINYRYCIDDGTPFLNELMRYNFYQMPYIQNRKKLVNDGGHCDSDSLMYFKLRLNPKWILKVFQNENN